MRFIDAAEVFRSAESADLIAPIRAAFEKPPVTPDRLHYDLASATDADATLLVMPAWQSHGCAGVKLVTVFPQNLVKAAPSVQGVYVLFDREVGSPLAAIDGGAMTLLRTAAVSALAADIQASPSMRTLLMVGTGALIPHLLKAHLRVRDYERILIWGRSREKADKLVRSLAGVHDGIVAIDDLEAAARSADLISCATLSKRPLLRGRWLRPGTHIDLVGAFTPSMREADLGVVARARILTDSPSSLRGSGDLERPLRRGLIAESDVFMLGHDVPARGEKDFTLFKSVGSAVSDLAAAEWIFRRMTH